MIDERSNVVASPLDLRELVTLDGNASITAFQLDILIEIFIKVGVTIDVPMVDSSIMGVDEIVQGKH